MTSAHPVISVALASIISAALIAPVIAIIAGWIPAQLAAMQDPADILRGEVRGTDLPFGQAEAFTAAWAVVVDGRLDRAGLAGSEQVKKLY